MAIDIQHNPISKEKVISILAEQIGVEKEDIKEEDDFLEDLHMNPAEITDFTQSLEELGVSTGKMEISTIETVGEFIEELSLLGEIS